MPLNVFLPFYAGDVDLLKDLLLWIGELGGCKKYKAVLITDPKSLRNSDAWPDEAKIAEVLKLARKSFKYVVLISTPYRRLKMDGTGAWPVGANWAFFCAALWNSMQERNPFLWLEPDATPLSEGWLETLEAAYAECGKPFMGAVLPTNLPNCNPTYMNGSPAVYPPNAMVYFDGAFIDFLRPLPFEQALRDGRQHVLDVAAFDLAAAAQVVPFAHATRLVQHYWGGERQTPPTFKLAKQETDPPHVFTLEALYPEAVVFHRCKDGSLRELLRAKRNESTLKAA